MKDIKFKTPVYLNNYHLSGTYLEDFEIEYSICDECGDVDCNITAYNTRKELIEGVLDDNPYLENGYIEEDNIDDAVAKFNRFIGDFPLEGGEITHEDLADYIKK